MPGWHIYNKILKIFNPSNGRRGRGILAKLHDLDQIFYLSDWLYFSSVNVEKKTKKIYFPSFVQLWLKKSCLIYCNIYCPTAPILIIGDYSEPLGPWLTSKTRLCENLSNNECFCYQIWSEMVFLHSVLPLCFRGGHLYFHT